MVGPVRIWGAGGATCHFGAGGPLETAAEGMVRVSRGLFEGSMWQLGHGVGWGSAHGHSGRVRCGELVDSTEPP